MSMMGKSYQDTRSPPIRPAAKGDHEFRCEVKICERLEFADFGYVDQGGTIICTS